MIYHLSSKDERSAVSFLLRSDHLHCFTELGDDLRNGDPLYTCRTGRRLQLVLCIQRWSYGDGLCHTVQRFIWLLPTMLPFRLSGAARSFP